MFEDRTIHSLRANGDPEFRTYNIMVKIFRKDKVEDQKMEITTTGLKSLLELRRLHSFLFSRTESSWRELINNYTKN